MTTPQEAIFVEGSAHHYFLEYNLHPRWDASAVRLALKAILDSTSCESNLVAAFGPDVWQKLAPEAMPENFIAFHSVIGKEERTAPGTQSDLLLWLHGERHDLNFAHALQIRRLLADIATPVLELHGFTYLDSRDLTGFIVSTENPQALEARKVALIPQEQPGAGGSFVMTQQWMHHLARFERLDVTEQESIIGRTKSNSVALSDAPATAHVRRVDVKVDDMPLKIYRRSAAFGNPGENGLYFLAFSAELIRFAMQLDRMFGLSEDGLMDRLTEFSTPVTGAYFFAPSQEALNRLIGTQND